MPHRACTPETPRPTGSLPPAPALPDASALFRDVSAAPDPFRYGIPLSPLSAAIFDNLQRGKPEIGSPPPPSHDPPVFDAAHTTSLDRGLSLEAELIRATAPILARVLIKALKAHHKLYPEHRAAVAHEIKHR